jgi:hypothetical protein
MTPGSAMRGSFFASQASVAAAPVTAPAAAPAAPASAPIPNISNYSVIINAPVAGSSAHVPSAVGPSASGSTLVPAAAPAAANAPSSKVHAGTGPCHVRSTLVFLLACPPQLAS